MSALKNAKSLVVKIDNPLDWRVVSNALDMHNHALRGLITSFNEGEIKATKALVELVESLKIPYDNRASYTNRRYRRKRYKFTDLNMNCDRFLNVLKGELKAKKDK